MNYKDNYGFFYKVKQTVYKWWCVVYKPTYKLFHKGYWPAEKEPYYEMQMAIARDEQVAKLAQAANVDAEDLASSILSSKQENIDTMVANTAPLKQVSNVAPQSEEEPDVDLSQVDPEALSKANEILARLASEAAADEAKKQAEIDAARKKAMEDEKAAIKKAKSDEEAAKSRAEEIMARLASEAAADEAKKQAEIDAARKKADEDARLASILKSTKVDISGFIEEGKAHRNDN